MATESIAQRMTGALDSALNVSQPTIDQAIDRIRRGRPNAEPKDVVRSLTRYYMSTVTASGAVAGASAIAPIGLGIGASALDFAGFLAASATYVLALAEVHDVPVEDLERRRMLVLATLLGEAGTALVLEKVAPRLGAHWGKMAAQAVPLATIQQLNKILGQNFVTRFGTRQGVLVLGKQFPLGVGAAIGAGGNAAFGYGVVKAAAVAFGPAPDAWHQQPQAPAPAPRTAGWGDVAPAM